MVLAFTMTGKPSKWDVYGKACMFLIGAGFAGFGCFWLRRLRRTGYIVIDKAGGVVSQAGTVRGARRGKKLCDVGDVAAVQVCSVVAKIGAGQSQREAMIFEVNLVLRSEENKRIDVEAGTDGAKMRGHAAKVADFLGVPVVDHS